MKVLSALQAQHQKNLIEPFSAEARELSDDDYGVEYPHASLTNVIIDEFISQGFNGEEEHGHEHHEHVHGPGCDHHHE